MTEQSVSENALSENQTLIIQQQCRQLLHQFAIGADHDLERFIDVFAEDCVWQRPGAVLEGPDNIRNALLAGRQKRLEQNPNGQIARHQMTSMDIRVLDGDNAKGIASCVVYRDEGFDGNLPAPMQMPEMVVDYFSEFSRTPSGWKIRHHRSQVVFKR